jgi:simple sugar transport system permease protein
VHALLLFVSVALFAFALWSFYQRKVRRTAGVALAGALILVWFLTSDSIPRQFVAFTPHIVTLLVMSFAAQRLRMPAADGRPYRKGENLV